MSIIDNCITKILSNDINNSFSILTYLDFDNELSQEFIFNYANNIVNNNPILKTEIVKQNNNFFLKILIILTLIIILLLNILKKNRLITLYMTF